MKRRDFLKATGIAALAPSLALPPSSASASTVFRLEAGVIERALTPFPDLKASMLWTYNGALPGPELRVKQGEVVQAELINALPEPTSIHWHGIRLSNGMDGVSMLTQPPVAAGERFQYLFVPP
jgi:Putative multicopper oxidases